MGCWRHGLSRLVKVFAKRLPHLARKGALRHKSVEVVERLVVLGLGGVAVGGDVAKGGEDVRPDDRAEEDECHHQRALGHRELRGVEVGAARAGESVRTSVKSLHCCGKLSVVTISRRFMEFSHFIGCGCSVVAGCRDEGDVL